eukprot:TRINITY_DN12204_c0_g1_i6.p6 TRINITY_DN12204_c0_g1~~TRINITY_DN12204_c0_g1_i6.p6  ORF type:complete len:141 (-),score=12.59 TRINITY_DN12204_c0_g1_i6:4046-4468(-)
MRWICNSGITASSMGDFELHVTSCIAGVKGHVVEVFCRGIALFCFILGPCILISVDSNIPLVLGFAGHVNIPMGGINILLDLDIVFAVRSAGVHSNVRPISAASVRTVSIGLAGNVQVPWLAWLGLHIQIALLTWLWLHI